MFNDFFLFFRQKRFPRWQKNTAFLCNVTLKEKWVENLWLVTFTLTEISYIHVAVTYDFNVLQQRLYCFGLIQYTRFLSERCSSCLTIWFPSLFSFMLWHILINHSLRQWTSTVLPLDNSLTTPTQPEGCDRRRGGGEDRAWWLKQTSGRSAESHGALSGTESVSLIMRWKSCACSLLLIFFVWFQYLKLSQPPFPHKSVWQHVPQSPRTAVRVNLETSKSPALLFHPF